jgi:flagellar biogenesis protein FliO
MCRFAIFETPALPTSMWLDYARTLLVLGGICVLALVAVKFVLPRLSGSANPSSGYIQVFARYPLEPRKTLYLVRAGKAVVLLASSAESIQLMTTLKAADFADADTPERADIANGSAFQRIAQAFADRNKETRV